MIDIGANLADKLFQDGLEDCILRAKQSDVKKIIITGSCMKSNTRAIKIATAHPDYLYTTLGIHPHNAKDYTEEIDSEIRTLHTNKCVKAVGETGLDYNRNYSSPARQQYAFEKQLVIAIETKLPIFLHERDAFSHFYNIIKEHRSYLTNGVVHCFTGDKKALFAYLDLDLHIGLTGWISDPIRGKHLIELIKNIPLNRLMIETDAPYLLPFNMPYKVKNKRNEPSFLSYVANSIAQAYPCDLNSLITSTSDTADNFFQLNE